jgi:Transposase, Mutator family
MRALLRTLVAKRRERTVEFELPKIESVADVLKTSSAVISACAAGELSPREASEIMELISSRVRDVYLDGIVLKRSWAGEIRNVSLLVAISVNGEGYREILGICEGAKEDKAGWSAFLKHLKDRGLAGIRLIVSDACLGLAEPLGCRGGSSSLTFPEVRPSEVMLKPFQCGPGDGRAPVTSEPCDRGVFRDRRVREELRAVSMV